MSNIYKIIGSEAACNTIPLVFDSARVLRIANKDTVARTITTTNNAISISITISNAVTPNNVVTLSVGNTDKIEAGYIITNSSNVGVVNTGTQSNVVSVINSTAFTANANIVLANGTTTLTVYETNFTMTILPNSEFILEKGSADLVNSNTASNVVATSIAFKN